MKALCTDPHNNLLIGIQKVGNNEQMRSVLLGFAPYDGDDAVLFSFVVHGNPMELSILEKYLTLLAEAPTEESLSLKIGESFHITLGEEGVLQFVHIVFNSIRAAIEYGLYRMTRKGGATSRMELGVYSSEFQGVYRVCSISPDIPLVPGDVLSAYDAWWKENKDVGRIDTEDVENTQTPEPTSLSGSLAPMAGIAREPF